jgi:DNA-binding transcriptional ArsR family regulator
LDVDVFEALADPVRRGILRQLAAGPARVVDLAAAHPVSRPAISRHLRVLGEAGLVDGQDRGRERHYRLVTGGLAPVHGLLGDLGAPVTAARRPPVAEHDIDALATEVRRTVRERRRRPATPPGTAATTGTTATTRQETA